MNDDFPADSDRPTSRWSVAPGSVSGSFRRPDAADSEKSASADTPQQPRLRPVSEILAEARSGKTAEPAPSRRRRAAHDIDPRPIGEHSPEDAHGRDDLDDVEDRDAGGNGTEHARRDTASETGPTKVTPKKPAVPSAAGSRVPRLTNAPVVGDRKELTSPQGVGHSPAAILAGFGGVLLIVIATAVGAVVDLLVSGMIGLFGAIGLCVGTAFAALITRKRDLLSILVAAPITYAVIGGLVLALSSRPVSITSVAQLAISGFPAMAIATGLAALIIGIKLLTTRVGERR